MHQDWKGRWRQGRRMSYQRTTISILQVYGRFSKLLTFFFGLFLCSNGRPWHNFSAFNDLLAKFFANVKQNKVLTLVESCWMLCRWGGREQQSASCYFWNVKITVDRDVTETCFMWKMIEHTELVPSKSLSDYSSVVLRIPRGDKRVRGFERYEKAQHRWK